MRIELINLFKNQAKTLQTSKRGSVAVLNKTIDEPNEPSIQISKNNLATLGINFKGYIDPETVDSHKILVKAQGFWAASQCEQKHSEEVLEHAIDVYDEVRDVAQLGKKFGFNPIERGTGKPSVVFNFCNETTLIMNELDDDGQIIRQSIFDENLEPLEVVEFSTDSNDARTYSYYDGYGGVIYSEYVLKTKEYITTPYHNQDIEKIKKSYYFEDFELKSIENNALIGEDFSEEVNEIYDFSPSTYFEIPNAHLIISKDKATDSKGLSKTKEVFAYNENGQLIAYENNRKIGPNHYLRARYDRLITFENGEIVSCYENK